MIWVLIAFLHGSPSVMVGPFETSAACHRAQTAIRSDPSIKREFPDSTARCAQMRRQDMPASWREGGSRPNV